MRRPGGRFERSDVNGEKAAPRALAVLERRHMQKTVYVWTEWMTWICGGMELPSDGNTTNPLTVMPTQSIIHGMNFFISHVPSSLPELIPQRHDPISPWVLFTL
jgi:hypothetical protein